MYTNVYKCMYLRALQKLCIRSWDVSVSATEESEEGGSESVPVNAHEHVIYVHMMVFLCLQNLCNTCKDFSSGFIRCSANLMLVICFI